MTQSNGKINFKEIVLKKIIQKKYQPSFTILPPLFYNLMDFSPFKKGKYNSLPPLKKGGRGEGS